MRTRGWITGLGIFMSILLSPATRGEEIFVSVAGSDDQSGSAESPLRTLAAAQHAARKLRGAGSGPITVTVRAGTYFLEAPLVFTPEDSGTEKEPVTWRAGDGEKVVLSGGWPLQLEWAAYRNGIYRAAVPAGLATDQLFVNGERQHMARYPNFDPAVAVFNGHAADAISPQRVARWADPTGGFFHAMHPGQWGGFSYRITGKDATGNVILEGGWQGNRLDKPHDKLRFIENIFEELDAPGEWYLDAKTHTLYLYPPEGTDLAKATIETVALRHLVELRGSHAAPVRWLTLRGFTFQRTARTFMATREPLLRSDWTIYRGGAVVFDGTEDCALSDCILDQLGGNAVFVNNYNRRVAVRTCRIERSGAGGVMFVGDPRAVRSPLFEYNQRQPLERIDRTPGPRTENYPAECLVEDCLITQVGRFEKQSTGVGMHMSARVTIRHCSIYDMPRAGINIGDGNWGGHVVEFCDVFDTVKETGDHGSFNSWGRDRFWLPDVREVDALVTANPDLPLLDVVEPIVLRNSRWRCDHGWDIDLDDGSSNYRIYNNLCLQGGIKNREGYQRTVKNNVLVGNGFHPHVWFADSKDVFARNIVFRPHEPIRMRGKWGAEVDYNLLHDPKADAVAPAADLQRSSRQDAHSLKGDAMFVDPARGDFSVRDGSPALTLGFKNFPMDGFGVRSAALRMIARAPSFSLARERTSRRDPTVRKWEGATLRNIIGEGERSAFGLPSEAGVLVLDVEREGRLARSGVRRGDVILALDKVATDEVQALLRAGGGDAGARLPMAATLKVYRNQKVIELRIE